ncbi:MAG: hypothetical protein M3Y17_03925 [Actinomycetota bacterium]|nr:hypothetical protein [Actinomycetota bacterium]
MELDERSTVGPDDFGGLVLEVFRLGHANWRGFNARSKPVSHAELLAASGTLRREDKRTPNQYAVK